MLPKKLSTFTIALLASARSIEAYSIPNLLVPRTPDLPGLNISYTCQLSLLAINDAPDASSCLNAAALSAALIAPQTSRLSDLIATWSQGMCNKPMCSNDTLEAVVGNVTLGCGADIDKLGVDLTGTPVGEVVRLVQEWYPPVREIACMKSTPQKNTSCTTEFLSGVGDVVGENITLSNMYTYAHEFQIGRLSLPNNVTCSNCTQAAYNIFYDALPGMATNSLINNTITKQCGTNFTHSPISNAINQTADTTTATISGWPAATSINTDIANSSAALPALAMPPIVALSLSSLFVPASAVMVLL